MGLFTVLSRHAINAFLRRTGKVSAPGGLRRGEHGMVKYAFRARFVRSPRETLKEPARARNLLWPVLEQSIRLQARDKESSIEQCTQLVLIGEGFISEAQATEAGLRCTAALKRALARNHIQFTKALNIRSLQHKPLEPYPCIKCNVAQRNGEKIYHLPFDQQYDRTLVGHHKLECYVATVAEAERLGFRRAFRWHGDSAAS